MSSDKPLISVIMGAYNCEKTIRQAVDSILAQTYANWEFVICDDCSTDNTLKILKEYERKDTRFKILHNDKNKRLAASLNACLAVSSGKYIARMDADDECLPERFSAQLKFLEDYPQIDVVGCSVFINDGNKKEIIRKPKENLSKKDVLWGPPFFHPTIMMRKNIYDQLHGYVVLGRTQRGQDWDLWFRFFANGFRGYNLQEPLYIYHESNDDLKKRTFKTAFMYTKTAIVGFKLLNVPFFKMLLVFKPIISVLIPQRIMSVYHNRKQNLI